MLVLLRSLNLTLVAFATFSVIAMSLSMPPTIARAGFCEMGICFRSEQANAWNSLAFTISSGCFISVVLFWLLVAYPDHMKRRRLKAYFAQSFEHFKIACTENFLCVADGGFPAERPSELLPVDSFKEYFKEEAAPGKTRWDEVANKMTNYYLEVTLSRVEIFRGEINFLLHEVDLSESDEFVVFKRISDALFMQRSAVTDYDSINSFLGLFWQLFAGWDFIDGYQEVGVVERLIDQI
ncbi:hypothetical protein [Hyphomonas oceanitis]|uniref:hypothetical protein n=1 Tax=Hyphomonas oceanitis TaxID=81033 RepID=UPI0030010189